MFGGTFDPIHNGHLRPMLEVMQGLGCRETLVVPARVPPHRPQPRLDTGQRLALVREALAECPGFTVDTRELSRSGPSYMVDTLRSLRRERGEHEGLCLVLGMDAFLGLPRWYRWEELSALAHLVVLDRPGSPRPRAGVLHDWLSRRQVAEAAELRRQPAGGVLFQPVSQLDISATAIRRLLAQGRSARFLMPERCWQRLARAGWYGYPQV